MFFIKIKFSIKLADTKLRSTSIESFNTNNRNQRGKTNLPKPINPSRTATSVVKQIIGDGATLVYDSLTPHTTPPLLPNHYYPNHHHQKQRKEHAQSSKTNLANTNQKLLTQFQTDFSSNTKKRNNYVR